MARQLQAELRANAGEMSRIMDEAEGWQREG